MLPVKNRLKNKKDFDRVFKLGQGFKQDLLFLKCLKNNLESSRFGFIVSTKFSKKAVDRNRMKRKLRAIVESKEFKPGFDCAFLVRPGLKEEGLEKKIEELLLKAKILR